MKSEYATSIGIHDQTRTNPQANRLPDLIEYQRLIEQYSLDKNFRLSRRPGEELIGNNDFNNNLYFRIFLNFILNDAENKPTPEFCAGYRNIYPNTTLIVGYTHTILPNDRMDSYRENGVNEIINSKTDMGPPEDEYAGCHVNNNFGCVIPKCLTRIRSS